MQEDTILIITKDSKLYNSIKATMQRSSIDTYHVLSLIEALAEVGQRTYHLIIWDMAYSEPQEIELIYLIRKTMSAPILALTECLNASHQISLFYAGVNAFLKKPTNLTVYAAQAQALIQLHSKIQVEDSGHLPLIFGNELVIYPMYRQVIIDGELLILTRTEFDLLLCLAQSPHRVWTLGQLYHHIWKEDFSPVGDHTVKTHLGNLKKKLADCGKKYIQNSRGVGYKFVPPSFSNEKNNI